MNPSPPMPVDCGSTTASTAAAATAASTALPPLRRVSMAVSVASGCDVAAAPSVARIGERPGSWKSRMGSAFSKELGIETEQHGALTCQREDAIDGRGGKLHHASELRHRADDGVELDGPVALEVLQHRGLVIADGSRPVDPALDIDGHGDPESGGDGLGLVHDAAHERPGGGVGA